MILYITDIFCLLASFALSIYVRYRYVSRYSARQVEGMESPVSRAIQTTVGYAGGIYITLSMLTAFLQIEMPAKIIVMNQLSVEPLAFAAIILAILQPFLLAVRQMLISKK